MGVALILAGIAASTAFLAQATTLERCFTSHEQDTPPGTVRRDGQLCRVTACGSFFGSLGGSDPAGCSGERSSHLVAALVALIGLGVAGGLSLGSARRAARAAPA
ncbi:MAG: hypothetical protein ACRDHY_05420 [Anaerolineales bacterium]